MDWVYSLTIQVFDMLLKLQVLEMCKKKRECEPQYRSYTQVHLAFPPLVLHQARGPFIDKCVFPVCFPGSLYRLHIKPNAHFAINIARGLRDASQALFN